MANMARHEPGFPIWLSFSFSNVRPLIKFTFSMARKTPFLKQTLATIFFILAIYALINTFLLPTTTPCNNDSLPSSSSNSNIVSREDNRHDFLGRLSAPVKIYLYDVPNRFTFGVIEQYYNARPGQPTADVQQLKYPGHQYMAEWFLFSDLRRPESDRLRSPAKRVFDPEEADLFYVPFFSSVSLVVNPIRPATAEAASTQEQGTAVYSDEETQEALVEWLEEQEHWKRNNGRDHVIIAQDPNALYKVIDKVKNSILLVSDFGRLRADQASLVKDVILPYSHRINSYSGDIGVSNRRTLLFFMGNRFRKEGGKIRDLLFKILEEEKDVIIKHGAQSRESRRAASQGMHTSKFCLNPAGDTPSACRLFDSIVSLCIPVIVSNHIELPFENIIDYRKIAIFVDSESAVEPGFLISMLSDVPTERILEYQKEMNQVKRYFEYEEEDGTVNEIWRQISQKLGLIKLMINREKRLVTRELKKPGCSCMCSNGSEISSGS